MKQRRGVQVIVFYLNIEYLTLSVDVITAIKLSLTAEEIRHSWLLKAWDRDEASKFALLSTDLPRVVNKWHLSSRTRLIQFLFHIYRIDAVAEAIREKRNNFRNTEQQTNLAPST